MVLKRHVGKFLTTLLVLVMMAVVASGLSVSADSDQDVTDPDPLQVRIVRTEVPVSPVLVGSQALLEVEMRVSGDDRISLGFNGARMSRGNEVLFDGPFVIQPEISVAGNPEELRVILRIPFTINSISGWSSSPQQGISVANNFEVRIYGSVRGVPLPGYVVETGITIYATNNIADTPEITSALLIVGASTQSQWAPGIRERAITVLHPTTRMPVGPHNPLSPNYHLFIQHLRWDANMPGPFAMRELLTADEIALRMQSGSIAVRYNPQDHNIAVFLLRMPPILAQLDSAHPMFRHVVADLVFWPPPID